MPADAFTPGTAARRSRKLSVERRLPVRVGVFLRGQRQVENRDLFRIEAGIHLLHAEETRDRQARAAQEHHGQRHLGHHQRRAQAMPRAAGRRAAGVLLERLVQVRLRRAPGRRQSEQHAGDQGDGQREREHAPVHGELHPERDLRRGQRPGPRPRPRGRAPIRPGRPPQLNRRLSTRSCRMVRQRLAPSAARTANSFRRERARASRRFATLAHAIASTKLTAPRSSQTTHGRLAPPSRRARAEHDADIGMGVRVRRGNAPGDLGHLGARLPDRDPGFQPRQARVGVSGSLRLRVATTNGVHNCAVSGNAKPGGMMPTTVWLRPSSVTTCPRRFVSPAKRRCHKP